MAHGHIYIDYILHSLLYMIGVAMANMYVGLFIAPAHHHTTPGARSSPRWGRTSMQWFSNTTCAMTKHCTQHRQDTITAFNICMDITPTIYIYIYMSEQQYFLEPNIQAIQSQTHNNTHARKAFDSNNLDTKSKCTWPRGGSHNEES